MYFDFKTLNSISGLGWGVGGVIFSLYYFSLQILRLYTDFELHVYPSTGRKVCGGGGLNVNLVFCFGPNLFLQA